MKTILLTGGTGFLGSHLAHRLYQDYRLIVLKRSFSDTWRLKEILNDLICYDIDHIELSEIFQENRIDIIIHTATCYGRKGESISDIVNTNLLFPLNLMELAIHFNTDTFFNTDTIAYKYLNSYSLSKKQLLEWLKQASDKIRIINMKLEHMYGPKDDENKFVTFLIRKMLKNETLDLTPGEQKRDFIFIDDVVEAYTKLIELSCELNDSFFEFEVGSGETISIHDFVNLICKLTTTECQLNFGALPYRENEIMESKADISKLLHLGWKPMVSLEKGLNTTIGFEKSQ